MRFKVMLVVGALLVAGAPAAEAHAPVKQARKAIRKAVKKQAHAHGVTAASIMINRKPDVRDPLNHRVIFGTGPIFPGGSFVIPETFTRCSIIQAVVRHRRVVALSTCLGGVL